jgi:hypothetical protein
VRGVQLGRPYLLPAASRLARSSPTSPPPAVIAWSEISHGRDEGSITRVFDDDSRFFSVA